MEEAFPTTTDPQPIELDTLMSEITTETIPSVLIPNNNDDILITVRQPFRSTSWIWTSTKKGRIQVRWEIPFIDTDYGRTQCMDGDKNAKMKINGENVGLQTVKELAHDCSWLTSQQRMN